MMKFACTCPSPISDLSHASISPCFATTWPRFTKPFLRASFQKSSRVFPLFASMFRAYALNVGLAMFPHRQHYLLSRTPLKTAHSDPFLTALPNPAREPCSDVLPT